MTATVFGQLLMQLGFPAGIAGVLIWHLLKHLSRQDHRIEALESYQRGSLSELLGKAIQTIERNTSVMERLEEYLERHDGGAPHARRPNRS